MAKHQSFLLNQKFNQDLLWNFGSYAFLAASGILMNLIIAHQYGAKVLGVFNQVFAAYVIASQLAVGGIHYSVLKQVAEKAHDPEGISRASWSAILAVLIVGLPVAGLVFLLSRAIGATLGSPAVGETMALAAPGLAFFSLNKVLLGILNGLHRMRAFAVGQALRYLLMIAFVVVVSLLGLPEAWLGAIFTLAEVILTIGLLVVVAVAVPPVWGGVDRGLLKTHISFGFKGFMSGAMLESNVRVDVVMLGLFLSDRSVGIYAFAAMLAEGFYNLLGVVRNKVNPVLVQMLKEERFDDILAMVRRLRLYVYGAAAGSALLLLGIYRPAVHLFLGTGDFLQSWSVLVILLGGIIFCSGYVPFDFILLQAGQPGYHTLLAGMNLLSNILFNALLIPHLGIYGAALGTAVAFSLSVFYLKWMVRWRLSLRLGMPFG